MIETDRASRTKNSGIPAAVWLVIAFLLLAAGVIASGFSRNTAWHTVLPIAGFASYLLAFRHALRLTKLEGKNIDDLWRSRSASKPKEKARRSTRRRLWNRAGSRKGTVTRWDFRKRPPSGDGPSGMGGSTREA